MAELNTRSGLGHGRKFNMPADRQIEIYRAIKASGARSHADIAAAVETAFS